MQFTSIVLALAVATNQFSSTFAAVVIKATGVPDSASTSDGAAIVIPVLDNDIYDPGTPDPQLVPKHVTDAVLTVLSIDVTTAPDLKVISGDATLGAGSVVASGPGNPTPIPTVTYTPALGFVGTVTFQYRFTATACCDPKTSTDTLVTVTVLEAVPQVFSNQGAFKNPGLREKVPFAAGAPSPVGINGILNQVEDTDSSDTFLSNTSPGVVQSNRGQSFTDFICNMPWSNCNN
jgi:hypothetical protein